MLVNTEKDVRVQFGLLTRQAFVDLHRKHNGCKILVIDFYKITSEGIELETSGFETSPFTQEDLDAIPGELGDDFGPNIDIVVILNQEAQEAMKFFRLCQVKHFVYFDFTDLEAVKAERDLAADYLIPYCTEKLKETFVKQFLEDFTLNITADTQSCLRLVQAESVDSVNHLVQDCKYFQCQVNHWKTDSLAVEKDLAFASHHVVFTGEASSRASMPQFKKGTCSDLSPAHTKGEAPQLLVTRDLEVLELYQLLVSSKTGWVNLWGDWGVGKSLIVKQLEYELRVRHMFPDGIYNFNLREMDQNKSIRKQMGDVLGIDFLVDTQEFFKNKRMLIILDGYERVMTTRLQTPVSLLEALMANGICTLFVTEPDEHGKMREVPDTTPYKIHRLSDFQSLQYLLALIAQNFATFLTFRRDSLDKFVHSTMVRDCKGLPFSLKKNAVRIFGNGLGIKLEASRCQHTSSSFSSPRMQNEASFTLEHDIGSDVDDDLRSHPSLYISSEASQRDKKAPPMNKAKSKHDGKKDGKHMKHKTKKKHKKEMH